ncbi:MAG: OmpA family protein, partial [Steroidobacteraceae bacterium]
KYRVLSDSLFAAFRGTPRTMEPVQVGEKQQGSGADVRTSLVEQSMIEGQPRSMLTAVPVKTALPTRPAKQAEPLTPSQTQAAKSLQKVADEVEHAMDDLVKANMVVVRRKDFFIEVEIRTDILFPSAKAQLSPSAVDVISRLGSTLAPFPNPIRVEGHTDDRPIKTVAFFSNWELSAARAGSVVRVLASRGVSPDRLAVIGYGENRPLHPNITQEGRNANRRVVVVILSTDIGKPAPQALPADDIAPNTAEPGAATLATEIIGAAPLPGTPVSPSESAPIATPLPAATAVPQEPAR